MSIIFVLGANFGQKRAQIFGIFWQFKREMRGNEFFYVPRKNVENSGEMRRR